MVANSAVLEHGRIVGGLQNYDKLPKNMPPVLIQVKGFITTKSSKRPV